MGAVVVSEDGMVVTKASELEGKLRAELSDQKRVEVTPLATDRKRDLAIVRLGEKGDFKDLPVVQWSDGTPEVGRWVITPGLSRTPAAVGVVSVHARRIPPETGKGVLGVAMSREPGPPTVTSVKRYSAAERAGIEEGDVILKCDGVGLTTQRSLSGEIQRRNPGDVVELTIDRDGEELIVRATLRHLPPLSKEDSREWRRNTQLESRWDKMNALGSTLSERRSNFPTAVQHDTVLQPEECGGTVVSLDGKAVGLNIARSGRTASFYLPASDVRPTIERLKSLAAGK